MILSKPYNLTYFITFIAIAAFSDHKYMTKYIKPYKMFYIGDFIMKNRLNTNLVVRLYYDSSTSANVKAKSTFTPCAIKTFCASCSVMPVVIMSSISITSMSLLPV